MSAWRRLFSLTAFVGALAASGTPARAETAVAERGAAPFDDVPIIADATLFGMRAGLVLASGLELQFGALARTLIDGQMVLETAFGFGENGGLPITPAELSAIERALPGSTIVVQGPSAAHATGALASGVGISALMDGPGVLFSDAGGGAIGFIQATPAQTLTLLASTGTNQRIDQRIDLIFSLEGFAPFQRAARAAEAADNLFDLIAPP